MAVSFRALASRCPPNGEDDARTIPSQRRVIRLRVAACPPVDGGSGNLFKSFAGKRIVLDEVHRLSNPSELLKIAADHFPTVHVLATGSSTLGASSRFRDTLAGRKTELWLTPMIQVDLACFGNTELPHRLLRSGLPPFFLSPELPEGDFQE